MRVSIIDDESPAVRILQKFVDKTEGLVLSLATTDALAGIDHINKGDTDLLLLDIEMPDIRGTELIQRLEHKPLIIFTTAYQEYAIEGYDLEVIDYLLKPIPYDRFLKAIARAQKQYQLISGMTKEDIPTTIQVTIDYKKVDIPYDSIHYVEGLKDYVKIYTTSGMKMTRMSIKGFESLIQNPQLKRIHRSYIVNMDKVDASNKTTVQIGDKIIPLGKKYQ